MRKYAIAAGVIAAVLVCAPLVAAKGPGGGWGKGLLSSSVVFTVDEATGAEGYMCWSPEVEDVFIFDFHGLYLEGETLYWLIYYYAADDERPNVYEELGSMNTGDCLNDMGVHIKGAADPPPSPYGLTFCLVPDSFVSDPDEWTPDVYLMAKNVNLCD